MRVSLKRNKLIVCHLINNFLSGKFQNITSTIFFISSSKPIVTGTVCSLLSCSVWEKFTILTGREATPVYTNQACILAVDKRVGATELWRNPLYCCCGCSLCNCMTGSFSRYSYCSCCIFNLDSLFTNVKS